MITHDLEGRVQWYGPGLGRLRVWRIGRDIVGEVLVLDKKIHPGNVVRWEDKRDEKRRNHRVTFWVWDRRRPERVVLSLLLPAHQNVRHAGSVLGDDQDELMRP